MGLAELVPPRRVVECWDLEISLEVGSWNLKLRLPHVSRAFANSGASALNSLPASGGLDRINRIRWSRASGTGGAYAQIRPSGEFRLLLAGLMAYLPRTRRHSLFVVRRSRISRWHTGTLKRVIMHDWIAFSLGAWICPACLGGARLNRLTAER
jgi:hypothetical protein